MGATAGLAVMGIASAGNAFSQSQATKSQAAFEKQQYETNARLADMQAQDAIDRGNQDAQAANREKKKVLGAQQAAFAANGVDISSDIVTQAQDQTNTLGELDALTIKNNAAREAWGYKVQSQNYSNQGQFAQIAGAQKAKNTLITGGITTLGYGTQAYGSYREKNVDTNKTRKA